MNIERLRHLIHVLSKVDPDNFTLNYWYDYDPDCGTTACAAGHACLDPEFNRQGLILDEDEIPTFDDYFEFKALEKFFDLTPDQVMHLFDPNTYHPSQCHDPRHVLARIRGLVTPILKGSNS